jgi:hypothetical protein
VSEDEPIVPDCRNSSVLCSNGTPGGVANTPDRLSRRRARAAARSCERSAGSSETSGVADRFEPGTRTEEPYDVEITVNEAWSFTGEIVEGGTMHVDPHPSLTDRIRKAPENPSHTNCYN